MLFVRISGSGPEEWSNPGFSRCRSCTRKGNTTALFAGYVLQRYQYPAMQVLILFYILLMIC